MNKMCACEKCGSYCSSFLFHFFQVENMDKTLDHIIKTITYLEWPGDEGSDKEINRFWDKLKLVMPKLKPPEQAPDHPAPDDAVAQSSTCSIKCGKCYP